jgi:hypothetical protein
MSSDGSQSEFVSVYTEHLKDVQILATHKPRHYIYAVLCIVII